MSKWNPPQYKQIDKSTLSESVDGTPSDVERYDRANYRIEWEGSSPVGEIFIETRNNPDDTWRALDFGSSISISGNSGFHDILIQKMCWKYMRARYAHTSGSFTSLTAKLKPVGQGA